MKKTTWQIHRGPTSPHLELDSARIRPPCRGDKNPMWHVIPWTQTSFNNHEEQYPPPTNNRILKGPGVVIPLIFQVPPIFLAGILRLPQLTPPLEQTKHPWNLMGPSIFQNGNRYQLDDGSMVPTFHFSPSKKNGLEISPFTLPKTNSKRPWKIGRIPKGNDRIPTIYLHVRKC